MRTHDVEESGLTWHIWPLIYLRVIGIRWYLFYRIKLFCMCRA